MMLSFASLLAAAPAAGASPDQSPWGMLPMMVLMGVVFYFLLIRPQNRQRKEQEKRIEALQKGDQVITTAGIHAIVHHIKDRSVVLKVAEGTLIEFEKNAVATVIKKDTAVVAETK